MTTDYVREGFEAWCRSEGFDHGLWMPHTPEAGYANARVMDYWTGWKAAMERHLSAGSAAAAGMPSNEYAEKEGLAVTSEWARGWDAHRMVCEVAAAPSAPVGAAPDIDAMQRGWTGT